LRILEKRRWGRRFQGVEAGNSKPNATPEFVHVPGTIGLFGTGTRAARPHSVEKASVKCFAREIV
jgi:hypothetical protein